MNSLESLRVVRRLESFPLNSDGRSDLFYRDALIRAQIPDRFFRTKPSLGKVSVKSRGICQEPYLVRFCVGMSGPEPSKIRLPRSLVSLSLTLKSHITS